MKCERFGLDYAFKFLSIIPDECLYETFSKIDRALWEEGNYLGVSVSKEDIPIHRFVLLTKELNLELTDFQLANTLFMEGFRNAVFPLDESYEIIEYISSMKIMIYIATNGLVKLQKPRVMNTSFGKYIDRVVASEEAGVNKPNPLIFQKILEDAKVSADEAIVIGDSLMHDVLGAKNAGIRSIWYNPFRQVNKSDISPDYEVIHLIDVKKIIDKL